MSGLKIPTSFLSEKLPEEFYIHHLGEQRVAQIKKECIPSTNPNLLKVSGLFSEKERNAVELNFAVMSFPSYAVQMGKYRSSVWIELPRIMKKVIQESNETILSWTKTGSLNNACYFQLRHWVNKPEEATSEVIVEMDKSADALKALEIFGDIYEAGIPITIGSYSAENEREAEELVTHNFKPDNRSGVIAVTMHPKNEQAVMSAFTAKKWMDGGSFKPPVKEKPKLVEDFPVEKQTERKHVDVLTAPCAPSAPNSAEKKDTPPPIVRPRSLSATAPHRGVNSRTLTRESFSSRGNATPPPVKGGTLPKQPNSIGKSNSLTLSPTQLQSLKAGLKRTPSTIKETKET